MRSWHRQHWKTHSIAFAAKSLSVCTGQPQFRRASYVGADCTGKGTSRESLASQAVTKCLADEAEACPQAKIVILRSHTISGDCFQYSVNGHSRRTTVAVRRTSDASAARAIIPSSSGNAAKSVGCMMPLQVVWLRSWQ